MTKRIGVVSLGCAKNLVDTEIMLGHLANDGYEFVADPHDADYIVVNTCGFIGPAKEESIETILEMAELKQTAKCQGLIVTGCFAKRYADDLLQEMPEIDGLLGTNELDQVAQTITKIANGERVHQVSQTFYNYDQSPERILTTGNQSYAYLKIAEGCNHTCAFCAIPHIRGKYRSRQPETIVREAEQVAKSNINELVVIAQDTTMYGYDLNGTCLSTLLEDLTDLNVQWIRLMYTYPTSLSDDVLAVMGAGGKVLNYVDLPLQHVSGNVLRRMGRPGDYNATMDLINKIRAAIPHVTIRSSFIVGFPGETEDDFQELARFLQEARLHHVGIFEFSPEEDTTAFAMDEQVSPEIMRERYTQLMELQQNIAQQLNEEYVGQEIDVLIEGISEESDLVMVGRHRGQAPDVDGVVYMGLCDAQPGDIVKVRIVEAHPYDLVGEAVEE